MSPYSYNSSNELTSTPVATFTYDANGSTLTKAYASGTTQYAWDFENRLSSVTLPGSGGTVTFKYDPFGRQIQKAFAQNSTTTTTNYLYDGPNSIEEVDANGNETARYAQSPGVDTPLAGLRSATTAFYQQDGLGLVTSLSDTTGALANTYVYDSFGNLTSTTGAFNNPFQYTGRDYDSETGMRYYRARYYDSASGRFISENPLGFGGGGPNFYDYTFNGSPNSVDPFGLWLRLSDLLFPPNFCPSFLPWCPGYKPKPAVKKEPPSGVCVCSRLTRFNGGWTWINHTGLSHNDQDQHQRGGPWTCCWWSTRGRSTGCYR